MALFDAEGSPRSCKNWGFHAVVQVSLLWYLGRIESRSPRGLGNPETECPIRPDVTKFLPRYEAIAISRPTLRGVDYQRECEYKSNRGTLDHVKMCFDKVPNDRSAVAVHMLPVRTSLPLSRISSRPRVSAVSAETADDQHTVPISRPPHY
jgi:hypothetical protein